MVEAEVAGMMAQFGAAGVVGWMWLSERRSASARERQLAEAHQRLMDQRTRLEVVVRAVEANTRALTVLEAGQRRVIGLLGSLAGGAWRGAGHRRRRESVVGFVGRGSRRGPGCGGGGGLGGGLGGWVGEARAEGGTGDGGGGGGGVGGGAGAGRAGAQGAD